MTKKKSKNSTLTRACGTEILNSQPDTKSAGKITMRLTFENFWKINMQLTFEDFHQNLRAPRPSLLHRRWESWVLLRWWQDARWSSM